MLPKDVIGVIFSFLRDVPSIIAASKASHLFYQLVHEKIVSIDENTTAVIPSSWILSFPHLHRVEPVISINCIQDCPKLAKQLKSAKFTLVPALTYIQVVPYFKLGPGYYSFGRQRHLGYEMAIYMERRILVYLETSETLLRELCTYLALPYVVTGILPGSPPEEIKEYTYIMSSYYPERPPLLDPYLDKKGFSVHVESSDICHFSMQNYLHLGITFPNLFTPRSYPKLHILDLPLPLFVVDIIIRGQYFPCLESLSLIIESRRREEDTYEYLSTYRDLFPDSITIYALHEDVRYRVKQWPLTGVTVKYPGIKI